MLMHAHHGTVDHLNVAIVGRDDGVHRPVPNARLAPRVEADVADRVVVADYKENDSNDSLIGPEDLYACCVIAGCLHVDSFELRQRDGVIR